MKVIDRVYGEQAIDDPLVVGLINTKEMQRLKGVDQYGIHKFANPNHASSRFDHSLGVYFLLRKFNAPKEEQVAGLIHDVAHMAFSHVLDYLYDNSRLQDTHHNFHDQIIKKSKIEVLLRKKNIDVNFILDDSNFPLLERPLPDLCADRLEYLFRGSLVCGRADKVAIGGGLDSLVIFDGKFVFKNLESARLMANLYLKMSRELWSGPVSSALCQVLADAVKIAKEKGIVSEKDFFLDDDSLLGKLKRSKNKDILFKLSLLDGKSFSLGTKDDYDIYTDSKVRYIDPEFLDGKDLERVSNVDESFKKDIETYRKWVEEGFYIKINKKR